MRFLSSFYNAFLGAMLSSIALFQSTWLEMRVNLGWVFLVLWASFFFVFLRFNLFNGLKKTTLNLFVCSSVALLLLGGDRILSVPAAVIREGLLMPRLAFGRINVVLLCILASGWFLIALGAPRYAEEKNKC